MEELNQKIQRLGSYCLQYRIELEDLQQIVEKRKETEGEHIHIQRFYDIEGKKIHSGDIRFDFSEQVLWKGKKRMILHEHEGLILQLLMANAKETVKDEEILKLLEKYDHKITKESMVVYMSRLSHHVQKNPEGEDYIRRHWKRGYYWNYKTTVRK